MFTILDDTDDSTLENVRPVYQLLRALGFRTTKTIWPLDCPEGSDLFFAADTLQRADYLGWVRELERDGFEIAFHGATMETSRRGRIEKAISFMERELGVFPRCYANHGFNRENLYWGAARFRTPLLRSLLRAVGSPRRHRFEGELCASPHFWGDICLKRFDYVRGFTFPELDLLRYDPRTPYTLSSTPFVRHWFSTTDIPDAGVFLQRVTRSALEDLETRGGVCILSTHFGKGFTQEGRVHPEVEDILSWLSERPGWFAPVSEVLDLLRTNKANRRIGFTALLSLELRFLKHQLHERWARWHRQRLTPRGEEV